MKYSNEEVEQIFCNKFKSCVDSFAAKDDGKQGRVFSEKKSILLYMINRDNQILPESCK